MTNIDKHDKYISLSPRLFHACVRWYSTSNPSIAFTKKKRFVKIAGILVFLSFAGIVRSSVRTWTGAARRLLKFHSVSPCHPKKNVSDGEFYS